MEGYAFMTYTLPFTPQQKVIELGGGNRPYFRPNLDVRSGENIDIVADFNEVLESNHQYIRDLTHERANLLEQLQDNERYFVRGPAGSGKSWMAFEQAKLWTAQGKKVAMIAFNQIGRAHV